MTVDYSSYDPFASLFGNVSEAFKNVTDILQKPDDTDVNTVLTSVVLNSLICLALMIAYECLRRILPTVYSSQKRMDKTATTAAANSTAENHTKKKKKNRKNPRSDERVSSSSPSLFSSSSSSPPPPPPPVPLLTSGRPLEWIGPVYGVSWSQVRRWAGLDGYFFLRYIRMNVRITAVSTFWFFALLVPVYASGGSAATGWYHYSIQNLQNPNDVKLWLPCLFLYLFSAFICFCIKQEYRHYLELRQDFLARGSSHVHPQHHYSLLIENIPGELRSDKALLEYFDGLFPGRVHSASVVLNLPDLEEASQRCLRTCRRLEKSLAYLHATGQRPNHIVGRGRIQCLGVDLQPLDCGGGFCFSSSSSSSSSSDGSSSSSPTPLMVDDVDHRYAERPPRGTRVDSISYYTQELAADSRFLFQLQQRKLRIAESGNASTTADNWFEQASRNFSVLANRILEDSHLENDLLTPHHEELYYYARSSSTSSAHYESSFDRTNNRDNSSDYSDAPYVLCGDDGGDGRAGSDGIARISAGGGGGGGVGGGYGSFNSSSGGPSGQQPPSTMDRRPRDPAVLDVGPSGGGDDDDGHGADEDEPDFKAPFSGDYYRSWLRRVLGRLGLDFCVAGIKAINAQLDVALEGVISATMSSTGFVTFLDLSSTTCAASARLSARSGVLQAHVAPEPREIRWQNAHVSRRTQIRRENLVNAFLFVGVILWSFPLAAIQTFANVKTLKRIPGLEWIETFDGGKLMNFVNGYLPVVALLGLILILPVIFEFLAVQVEHRKTFSDIQASMLSRYFYYQLANVYISSTAGSLLKSLGDIINSPRTIVEELGNSLPTMAGYFVALLVTKILAGLPMIFLRFAALSRMLLLKTLSNEKRLTQRELDSVYRLENVQYGWEFPTQLLVVVIVFTYAVICPVILPVGCCYFMGALLVYKKQVLYVYSPVYESGGLMFPIAVQRSLFGLVCGQLTFIGYLLTKKCRLQPLFLLPCPILTVCCMSYFNSTYVEPGKRLSLERAREHDRITALQEARRASGGEGGSSDAGVEARRRTFDRSAYRQPVLTELAAEPWTYRRGIDDPETITVRDRLRQVNRYTTMQLRHATVVQASSATEARLDLLSSP